MAEAVKQDDDFVKIGKELFKSSDEHPRAISTAVTGKIPDWFEGTLLRVGPGNPLPKTMIFVD